MIVCVCDVWFGMCVYANNINFFAVTPISVRKFL